MEIPTHPTKVGESQLDECTYFNPTETFQYTGTTFHATNMELKEVSSKERLLNFSELTLLRHYFEDRGEIEMVPRGFYRIHPFSSNV